MNIMNKLKNIIKLGVLKTLTDEKTYQIAKSSYMGVEQKGILYNPFGFYSKPKKGALCGIFNVGSTESSQIVITWNPKKRPTIADGESAVWNEKSEAGVYLRNDGSIEFDNKHRKVVVFEDSISIENKDGTPIGDINFGSQGLLDFIKNMTGVGNLSIPVPVDPANKLIIETTMLTASKIEIK